MSDYTIKNLKGDVEDAAPNFGLSPELEARFARKTLECKQTGVSYERLAPNVRTGFGHKHANQEEIYVVISGGGRVKIEDDVNDVRQWDAVRVGPSTMREFEAGSDGLEVIAFGAPTSDEDDSELVPGWWSD
jgi:mannose-6-phosphate isomerase-like protein (cupin superfamily)